MNLHDVCHHAQTVGNLKVESGAHIVYKSIRVCEILWMLVVGAHHVSSVVVVCTAVFGGIWNIHWNQDAVVIAAIARCALIGDVVLQAPQVAVGELQVSYREHLIDFQSVVTDVSVLLEIEIAVVGVLVVDRRIQLGYAHLHSRKCVAV